MRLCSAAAEDSIVKNHLGFMLATLILLSACGGAPSEPPPPPNLQLSPAGLSFGVEVVGSESAAQTETLTNTGGSDLDLSSVVLTGANATDFSQSGTCGSTLGAGASCIVHVTFTPTQIGPRSASLTIADNGLKGTQLLSLTGIGGTAGANATVSPSSVNFGNQKVNTTSAAQPVTLSNYGTVALDITDISVSTDFSETNNCSATLASGASCTVNVTFTPGGTGSFAGTLSVADVAPDSPQGVSLSGDCSTGSCQPQGQECFSGRPCCAGLACVPEGDRAKCEPEARFVLREPWTGLK